MLKLSLTQRHRLPTLPLKPQESQSHWKGDVSIKDNKKFGNPTPQPRQKPNHSGHKATSASGSFIVELWVSSLWSGIRGTTECRCRTLARRKGNTQRNPSTAGRKRGIFQLTILISIIIIIVNIVWFCFQYRFNFLLFSVLFYWVSWYLW